MMDREREVTVSDVLKLIAKLTPDDKSRLLTTLSNYV